MSFRCYYLLATVALADSAVPAAPAPAAVENLSVARADVMPFRFTLQAFNQGRLVREVEWTTYAENAKQAATSPATSWPSGARS